MFQTLDFLPDGSTIYWCWKIKIHVAQIFKWLGVVHRLAASQAGIETQPVF